MIALSGEWSNNVITQLALSRLTLVAPFFSLRILYTTRFHSSHQAEGMVI